MQTFLPLPNFYASAKCLDDKRLGKQRVEAWQLFNGQWSNHPASEMWRGYEYALARYITIICREWMSRGFKDFILQRVIYPPKAEMPWWLGHENFHKYHRSNLLAKDPIWYGQWGWDCHDNYRYIWPGGKGVRTFQT